MLRQVRVWLCLFVTPMEQCPREFGFAAGKKSSSPMNKAFVREIDDGPTQCPRCGGAGVVVQTETLVAQITAESRAAISGAAWFCPTPTCDVVYFDAFGGVVPRAAFDQPIAGKDLDAPLCPCFGLTRAEVEADVAENVVTRTKAAVVRAQSAEARCQTLAPSGQSCLAAVQGYYLKCKHGGG